MLPALMARMGPLATEGEESRRLMRELVEETVLGGNAIGFFWPEKRPQYRPENRPEVPFEKDTCTNIQFMDISGCFSGPFYYCGSVLNSIGQKMARKAARKMARVY